jgi:sugar phosphate isomerase/epimerase
MMTSRRDFLKIAPASAASAWLWGNRKVAAAPIRNEFFAMDTAMVVKLGTLLEHGDIEDVASLGYGGIGPVAENAAAWQHLREKVVPWLDEYKLKLYAVYGGLRVGRESCELSPGIQENLAYLKSHGTKIWLPVSSKEFGPSDRAADGRVVAATRDLADRAAAQGLSIALYPHFGNLVERVADAVRIADLTERQNVGVTFNLCHWLRTDGPDSMDRVLKLAAPRLSLVTINGADRDGKDWKQLIQPLGQGSFDVSTLLSALDRLGYRGPVGLQGYDVARQFQIAPHENLKRSMAAWKKLRA